jgi:hypothetical protein
MPGPVGDMQHHRLLEVPAPGQVRIRSVVAQKGAGQNFTQVRLKKQIVECDQTEKERVYPSQNKHVEI